VILQVLWETPVVLLVVDDVGLGTRLSPRIVPTAIP
jgi:hypothetical protein